MKGGRKGNMFATFVLYLVGCVLYSTCTVRSLGGRGYIIIKCVKLLEYDVLRYFLPDRVILYD